MSGIAGFVAIRPGDPVPPSFVHSILTALAHRGPDGTGQATSATATFGHAWLNTDSAPGPGPYRLRPDGPILTCDIRLESASALAILLAVDPGTSAPELILRAYDQWGTDCVTRIEGAFAFALWDPANALLFCARDRMGIKPFAWRRLPQGFAFSSEPAALLGWGGASDLDERWIADFLAGQIHDSESTAWASIRRLEPAHILVVATGTEPQITRYWTLTPAADRPADVPTELRKALTEATRSAMQGGRAGAMLSGGLDSSTVSLLARDIRKSEGPGVERLPVFLLTFPDSPALDERAYMDAVLATGGFAAHWIKQRAQRSGLTAAMQLLYEQGQPFAAPAMPATYGIYGAAAKTGVRILLDGHGGDEVISYGTNRVKELIAAGDWSGVWRETPGLASLEGLSRSRTFLRLMSDGAKSRVVRGVARRMGGANPTQSTKAWREMVHPDLVARSDLVGRTKAAHEPAPTAGMTAAEIEAQNHAKMIVGPLSAQAFEILNCMAAHQGIEARYPFYDRRVVELCIAQPASSKLRDGWTRALLRDAMRDVLPDPVLRRRDKVRFNVELVRGLLEDQTGRLDQLEKGGRLDGYINMDVLRRHLTTLRRDGLSVDPLVFVQIWRAAWLDIWLQQAATQPLRQGRQA